ncbi:antirestriction protein [Salibacterium salarium]|uniref:hypothetical protein n=1 Tax=Salibacterium salarium TaxID=284579 RepID=UPI0027848CDA|nr:hypothetical protein [Salibacterium salarium]MDQ0298572.1 antirestriction protein [Salibacterium salarium]
MKRWMLIFAVMISVAFPHVGEAESLSEVFLFKATVEADDETYHWEYNSPDNFEYHVNGKALHGGKAKQQVEDMYEDISLSQDMDKEAIARAFRNAGYEDMSRIDVRWQDENGDLYTWLWDKNQE